MFVTAATMPSHSHEPREGGGQTPHVTKKLETEENSPVEKMEVGTGQEEADVQQAPATGSSKEEPEEEKEEGKEEGKEGIEGKEDMEEEEQQPPTTASQQQDQ